MTTPAQPSPSDHPGSNSDARTTGLIDGFLTTPFSGIAPWVLLAVMSGPGRFEQAASAALGLSLLVLWVSHRRGIAVHLLEVFGVAFFAVFTAVGAVASAMTIRWLELWAGELTNVALAVFATATLVIRRPFTLAYARDTTPRDLWSSPVFLRVNYVISAVWAGAFFVSAIFGFYGDAVLGSSDNFWTGWILQLAALFLAVSFTDFYPDFVQATASQRAGDTTDTPPSVGAVFDWIPTFVLVTGIVGVTTNSVSHALGYVLVATGGLGAAIMRRRLSTKAPGSRSGSAGFGQQETAPSDVAED